MTDTNGNGGAGGTGGAGNGEDAEAARMLAEAAGRQFTQADVDRIVTERLARAKTTPPADYADLQAKAAKFDELEAANKTELEKILARAEAAEKAAATATERARQSDLRSAVIAEATKAGAVDPDAVFALMSKDAVTIGDDGQVTGADDAVKALLESKPYLVGQSQNGTKTGSADGGARGGTNTGKRVSRDDLTSMSPDAIAKAYEAGELNHLLAES